VHAGWSGSGEDIVDSDHVVLNSRDDPTEVDAPWAIIDPTDGDFDEQ